MNLNWKPTRIGENIIGNIMMVRSRRWPRVAFSTSSARNRPSSISRLSAMVSSSTVRPKATQNSWSAKSLLVVAKADEGVDRLRPGQPERREARIERQQQRHHHDRRQHDKGRQQQQNMRRRLPASHRILASNSIGNSLIASASTACRHVLEKGRGQSPRSLLREEAVTALRHPRGWPWPWRRHRQALPWVVLSPRMAACSSG